MTRACTELLFFIYFPRTRKDFSTTMALYNILNFIYQLYNNTSVIFSWTTRLPFFNYTQDISENSTLIRRKCVYIKTAIRRNKQCNQLDKPHQVRYKSVRYIIWNKLITVEYVSYSCIESARKSVKFCAEIVYRLIIVYIQIGLNGLPSAHQIQNCVSCILVR